MVLAGVLLLGGCHTLGNPRQDFAHRLIRPGSELVLEQAITIPAEDTAVYVQGGRVVTVVNEMRPYCKFAVWTRLEEQQEVAPDRFVIRRVNWGTSYIQATRPVMVALVVYGHRGAPDRLYYQTELYLSSERQPDVYRITCEVDRIEAGGHSQHTYLTLSEVRGALEGLFRLELASGP